MVAALCVGAAARAEPLAPMQVEGRWVNTRHNLILDISRCGESWCGVEVRDNVCAKTALRMTARPPQEKVVWFDGRLTLTDRGQPYVISATMLMEEAGLRLQLLGNPGDKLEVLRRWYPLNELMVRSGSPQCKPGATVS